MNYTESYELLDASKLLFLLEDIKNISSEIIVVPRCIFQNSIYSSILGVKANTIYSISAFEDIIAKNLIVYWNEESLEYICFKYSDIAPFIRTIVANNLGRIEMHYKTFIVNGERKSIATHITTTETVKISTPTGETDWIPNIPLIPPYQIFESIQNAVNSFENGKLVAKLNPKDDEFIDIWNQRATDGAKVWIPKFESYSDKIKPYIVYLSKSMFSVAKKDQVELEIRDNIPQFPGHFFMTKFTVSKTKKKMTSYHNYYMMEIMI